MRLASTSDDARLASAARSWNGTETRNPTSTDGKSCLNRLVKDWLTPPISFAGTPGSDPPEMTTGGNPCAFDRVLIRSNSGPKLDVSGLPVWLTNVRPARPALV